MKECNICHGIFPLSEFYKNKAMPDGHLKQCKSCRDILNKSSRDKRKDYYLEYDRQRHKKKEAIQRKVEYNRKDPKRNARVTLYNALVSNKISKLPCFICGDIQTEAHHTNYDSPLDVTWLCFIHHRQLHKEAKLFNG